MKYGLFSLNFDMKNIFIWDMSQMFTTKHRKSAASALYKWLGYAMPYSNDFPFYLCCKVPFHCFSLHLGCRVKQSLSPISFLFLFYRVFVCVSLSVCVRFAPNQFRHLNGMITKFTMCNNNNDKNHAHS